MQGGLASAAVGQFCVPRFLRFFFFVSFFFFFSFSFSHIYMYTYPHSRTCLQYCKALFVCGGSSLLLANSCIAASQKSTDERTLPSQLGLRKHYGSIQKYRE